MIFVSSVATKKQKHWAHRFNELISGFNLSTWLSLILSTFTNAYLIKMSNLSNGSLKYQTSLWDIYFSTISSILDQGSAMFHIIQARTNMSFYHTVYTVPFAWLYLSTLYKGDNITNLTTEPPLTPFDTFDSLVENNFQTYSRTFKFDHVSSDQTKTMQNGTATKHERFPFVFELWVRVMEQYGYTRQSEFSLELIRNEIPNTTWHIIQNFDLFPDKGQRLDESFNTMINLHMDACNKSAMIIT